MANAGVVGMSEVIVPNSTTSSNSLKGSAAMWSFVWVGAAILFLMFVHLAMAGRAGR
jgi:hypothetical protein